MFGNNMIIKLLITYLITHILKTKQNSDSNATNQN